MFDIEAKIRELELRREENPEAHPTWVAECRGRLQGLRECLAAVQALGNQLSEVVADRSEWIQTSRDWRVRAEAAEAKLRAVSDVARYAPCEVDPDDGPAYQGFLTDPAGEWVKWDDVRRAVRGTK